MSENATKKTEENKPVDPTPVLRYLDPEEVKLFKSEEGRLRLVINNELSILAPRFLRVCPLNDPDRYISIREHEPGGKEIGILRNWHKLEPESRELLCAELDRRYIYPILKSILSVQDIYGTKICDFETDRGVREVTLRDIRDNIVYIGTNRILITDAEGNRYDIPNLDALDRSSRTLLMRIL